VGPGRVRAGQNGGPTIARYAFQSVGIKLGEEINISVANFHDVPPPCRIRLLDSTGNIVADSGEFRLPAQGTIHFTVPYSKLPAVQDGARRQVRAVVLIFRVPDSTDTIPPPCRPGIELVSSLTGHTFGVVTPREPEMTFQ
jgi:hypothetical protein